MSLDLYFYNRGSCVCEACGNEHEGEREVWRGNITHNLTQMADLALLPAGGRRRWCSGLIPLLAAGLADPEKFQALNPSNGWGCYGGLVSFVRSLLGACREWPGARVEPTPQGGLTIWSPGGRAHEVAMWRTAQELGGEPVAKGWFGEWHEVEGSRARRWLITRFTPRLDKGERLELDPGPASAQEGGLMGWFTLPLALRPFPFTIPSHLGSLEQVEKFLLLRLQEARAEAEMDQAGADEGPRALF